MTISTKLHPFMYNFEIDTIHTILRKHRPMKVFEYGSGYSTIEFPNYMRFNYQPEIWDSLEHEKLWYEEIVKIDKQPFVHIYLCDHSGINPPMKKWKSHCWRDYIEFPLSLNRKYDFILVDGRSRRRCLHMASTLLNLGGFVILHDAQRKHYHEGFTAFKYGRQLCTRLWIGSQDHELSNEYLFGVTDFKIDESKKKSRKVKLR